MNKNQYKIVGLGEVLFDILPNGKKMPGGAPANFAYVSNSFGNHGIVASRVGNDENGTAILQSMEKFGVDISHIQTDAQHSTGNVQVSLENGQPDYEITENVAWDFLELTEDWRDLAKHCDAVCFGTLAQRNEFSRKTIREFVNLTGQDCWRIFDVNLRQNYFSDEILRESLKLANILKLNYEELPIILDLLKIEGDNVVERSRNLVRSYKIKLFCLTRGADGSILLKQGEFSENDGKKSRVKDTIGAGDAFTAALTHGLLRGWDLDKINEFANKVGAFVASQTGAMPNFPKKLF